MKLSKQGWSDFAQDFHTGRSGNYSPRQLHRMNPFLVSCHTLREQQESECYRLGSQFLQKCLQIALRRHYSLDQIFECLRHFRTKDH
jgi:hypothetical protein